MALLLQLSPVCTERIQPQMRAFNPCSDYYYGTFFVQLPQILLLIHLNLLLAFPIRCSHASKPVVLLS